MDLQRKTLGQLMSNVLGIGNQSKAVKADAPELEADATQDDDEQDGAADDDESADDAENEGDEQEEAPTKKATAPKAKTAAAGAAAPGTVTLKLADYNALQAQADQAKTLKAANATLKTKASAWDAHQKAIGGAAPKADTTNDAPDTEENAEAKEMNRLSERYKGMIPA